MKTVKCASCGAPFEELPGDEPLRCEFCGAINERTIIRPAVPRTVPPPPRPPAFPRDLQDVHVIVHPSERRGSGVGRALGCFMLMFVLSFGGAMWFFVTPGRHLVPALPGALPSLPKMPFARRSLADLRELHDRGRLGLDAPPPAGGYARFDAVAELPWALKIAQAWQADARLERIDVSRVTPAGLVDVAGDPDAEVMYRFVSPSRVAQYWREADVNQKAESDYEFWVIAKGGGAFVQLLRSRPSSGDKVAPPPQVLTLAATFERARPRFPARPFYRGYMIYADRDGWVWYLSTLSGRESVPRVRGRDGRTWPW